MLAGLLLAKIIVVLLGLLIAFQGYRAAKREESQRMLLIAGGFTLLSIGSVLEGICHVLLSLSTLVSGLIQAGIVGTGMTLIIMSLFIPGSIDTKSREGPGGGGGLGE